jgi:hypothetical protein
MMKQQILFLLVALGAATAAFSDQPIEEESRKTSYIPVLTYDLLSLERETIHSPGIGLIAMNESVTAVALYTRHSTVKSSLEEYPDLYHSLEFLIDGKKERHNYLLIFCSNSDKPGYGGLHTFQSAAVYGYEVVGRTDLSITLGGGLAVSDFGIELDNGEPWPLFPVPLVRINYTSTLAEASFEFLTGPNLSLTLAPQKQIRLTADFRMDQFRNLQDLIFEGALHYRFLPESHPMGDLAGLALGVKNNIYTFDLAKEKTVRELQYYSVFGELDLTLLKIGGGWAFTGRDEGSGFHFSIQGMYQF